MIPSRTVQLPLATALLLMTSSLGQAQESSGADWARAAGGGLGLYQGAILATTAALVPCSQTYAGVKCVRVVGITGGILGVASGIYLGGADADQITTYARGAGIGFVAGTALGFGLTPLIERWRWSDAMALGLVGGAIGASPVGSTIGLGAGTFAGVVLWQAVPGFELPDAVGVALIGMAVGGLSAWVVNGVQAHSGGAGTQQLVIPLTLTF